jgi:hypothetical protein
MSVALSRMADCLRGCDRRVAELFEVLVCDWQTGCADEFVGYTLQLWYKLFNQILEVGQLQGPT